MDGKYANKIMEAVTFQGYSVVQLRIFSEAASDGYTRESMLKTFNSWFHTLS